MGKRKDSPEIKYIHPTFRIISENDTTLSMTAFAFSEKTDTLFLHARFKDQDTIKNSTFYGKENVILSQRFNLINPSVELQRVITNTSDLYTKYKNIPANQFYDIFHQMISQAPDSHSNILLLYNKRNWFSLEQLVSLKKIFTEQQQQSHYGKRLNEYIKILTEEFPDIQLTNCITGEKEMIIANEKKYTLLVFSASWCAPCHKMIPLLKELYEKKKEVMDIVYITLDNQKQLPAWLKLLKEEQITWRSLTVDGKIDEIRDKYKVRAIPYSYLIYPKKKKADVIDIRESKDKQRVEDIQLSVY